MVCGSFQRDRFYQASDRWSELARRSRWSLVFADFPDLRPGAGRAGPGAALRRGSDAAGVGGGRRDLAAGRLLARMGDARPGRRTRPAPHLRGGVDDRSTRDSAALRTCAEWPPAAGLAQAPDLLRGLDERPVVAQTDPTRASALFNRAIGYVDRAITSSGR